jgi:hypothetical protein
LGLDVAANGIGTWTVNSIGDAIADGGQWLGDKVEDGRSSMA